jgi:hypothetical protein
MHCKKTKRYSTCPPDEKKGKTRHSPWSTNFTILLHRFETASQHISHSSTTLVFRHQDAHHPSPPSGNRLSPVDTFPQVHNTQLSNMGPTRKNMFVSSSTPPHMCKSFTAASSLLHLPAARRSDGHVWSPAAHRTAVTSCASCRCPPWSRTGLQWGGHRHKLFVAGEVVGRVLGRLDRARRPRVAATARRSPPPRALGWAPRPALRGVGLGSRPRLPKSWGA